MSLISVFNGIFDSLEEKLVDALPDASKEIKQVVSDLRSDYLDEPTNGVSGNGVDGAPSSRLLKPNRAKPSPLAMRVLPSDPRVFLIEKFPTKNGVSKSLALVGPFDSVYSDFKNEYLKGKKLAVGFNKTQVKNGWLIYKKSTKELERAFRKEGIEYQHLDHEEYLKVKDTPPVQLKPISPPVEIVEDQPEKEEKKDKQPLNKPEAGPKVTAVVESVKKTFAEGVDSLKEEEELPSSSDAVDPEEVKKYFGSQLEEINKKAKPEAAPPVLKAKPDAKKKPKIGKPDKHGLVLEQETGMVLFSLPTRKIGDKVKKSKFVIGFQDPSRGDGLDSVWPLDADDETSCKEWGWPYLTDKAMGSVKKLDKDLYHMLEQIKARGEDEEEEEDGEDGDKRLLYSSGSEEGSE